MILDPASDLLSRRQVLIAACGSLCLVALVGLRVGTSGNKLQSKAAILPSNMPSDPAAIAFLKQSMDTYAALKTFRADVDYVMSFSDTDALEAQPLHGRADYQRTVAYAAPNRFRITSTTYGTLKHFYTSDGTRMVNRTEGYGNDTDVQTYDAPASLAVADQNNMNHPHFGGSALYRFFAGDEGYDRLIDEKAARTIQKQKPHPVRFGPDITIDSEPCKTVIFGGGLFDHERRAIISTRDHLVRRMEYREMSHRISEEEITRLAEVTNEDSRHPEVRLAQVKAQMQKEKRTHSPNALAVEYYTNIVTDAAIPETEFANP